MNFQAAARLPLIGIAAAAAASLILYAFIDPADTAWLPKCPVHLLTGFDCPGCGSQRALHAIFHGDLAEALRFNAMLFLFIPLIVLMALIEMRRERWPKAYKALYRPAAIYSILGLIAGWTILRNIFWPLS